MTTPTRQLNDGGLIPVVGFGTHRIPDDQAAAAVSQALDVGYRHIDTAQGYQNERGVGHAIASSGLPRGELFVTTKLTNSLHGRNTPRLALLQSLDELQLDYVDLYLIHWPTARGDKLLIETWEALLDLRVDGLASSVGVSNFNPEHLRTIIDATGEPPAVNQIEYHPEFVRAEFDLVHEELGVVTEAWAPLGQNKGLLDLPLVVELSNEYGVTPAQLVLRWSLQRGNVVLPSSTNLDRARSNLDVFSWGLDADDMEAIDSLNAGRRLGPDPLQMNRPNRAGDAPW